MAAQPVVIVLEMMIPKLLSGCRQRLGKRRDRAGQIRDKSLFYPQLLLMENRLEADDRVDQLLVVRQADLFVKPVAGFPGTVHSDVKRLCHVRNTVV